MRKQMARPKSPVLVLTLVLAGLSLLFFVLLSFRSGNGFSSDGSLHPNPIYKPETSFVASLERFLLAPHNSQTTTHQDPEDERLYSDPYYPLSMPLRVYVYDMPSKFTYDLLRLFITSYKDTSDLTSNGSPVHRLIEQVFFSFFLLR